MKKEKLKLEDLKVQSFVTSLHENEKLTVEGGNDSNYDCGANTEFAGCAVNKTAGGVCLGPARPASNPTCSLQIFLITGGTL